MWKGFSGSAPQLSTSELAKEIDNLSSDEKARVYDDLYGRCQLFPELLDDVETALREFQQQLREMPERDKVQYTRALEQCPDYINDHRFHLMFLRSEKFDAEASASRMVTYWDSKVELFGPDRAFRRLTVNDLLEEDAEALQLGGLRFLPEKDCAGRGIIVIDRTRFDQRTTKRKSMIRFMWYIHHIAMEDEDVQRNGLVYIAGSPRRRTTLLEQDRKLDSLMLRHVRCALPVRVVGVHHYLSSKILEFVVPVLLPLFGASMRARYKPHMGDENHFLDGLAAYGILPDMLPCDLGGTSDFSYGEWLEHRRELE